MTKLKNREKRLREKKQNQWSQGQFHTTHVHTHTWKLKRKEKVMKEFYEEIIPTIFPNLVETTTHILKKLTKIQAA